MAIDLPRRRLFVAELGNDTVGVDLNEQKVRHIISELKERQGVGYVPSTDTLFVANAGDGSVLLFRGAEYAAVSAMMPTWALKAVRRSLTGARETVSGHCP
jgi:hypothetical protein